MKKYVENMRKYKGYMKKYEGIMKDIMKKCGGNMRIRTIPIYGPWDLEKF